MGFDIVCTDDCGWGAYSEKLEEAIWLRGLHHASNHRTIVFDRELNKPVKLRAEKEPDAE